MHAITETQRQTLHARAMWLLHVRRPPSVRELAQLLRISRMAAHERVWWLNKKLSGYLPVAL